MELEELKTLLGSPADLVKAIQKNQRELNQKEALEQYQPETHAVLDTGKRPKKQISKPTGRKNDDGSDEMQTSLEEVARIPVALQKLIVGRAATFLTGQPVTLHCKPNNPQEEKLQLMVEKIWQDAKLNFKNRPIAKTMMAEKEVVELWSFVEAEEGYWGELGNKNSKLKLRLNILKPSEGNTFYPVYDKYGDMIAFGRGYFLKEGEKEVEMLDLYTAEQINRYSKGESSWALVPEDSKSNVLGKLPIVYYSQTRTEWQDVQWAIERLETLLSNHADTNDYNGSPILVSKGKVAGMATKGERGKVFEVEEGGDLKYITWDNAPESIKLEIENLFDIIYTITQTPNITFKEMKGLGQLSGIAIKLMFLDAHGKAKDKQDDYYGECIQRRINLLKAAAAKINVDMEKVQGLNIVPEFALFMPDNEVEKTELQGKQIDNLLRATGEKAVMSQQTAVEHNPLVENVEDELKLIQKQEEANELRLS
ncbi:phage portal protein [Pontibacter sp. BT731]|uniref:phage portal protein n=1 Tax=Pontibacter coccineus TaxID=3063328 RepID=UPI0026E3C3B4|nr:phage portal protein [Pontibacter sp. BT731]MDO6389011.1 phage portal protein [Pontibacter sp. BT731]